ncbi:ubiquitin carboxyl-terminal hydrolase 38-like [Drosophila montana]|uniref:ubiquitin carboxyl-terminal hydrolase 38-like n=1 Tax=Drosophila montana TaxID=40370 RepID=UPI00313C09D3
MTPDFLLLHSSSQMIVELQHLIALLHHAKCPKLKPTSVLIGTHPPEFMPGVQQDSSEYLGHLLNMLHEHEAIMGWEWPNVSTITLSDPMIPLDLVIPYSDEMSITNKSFAGKLSTLYKCLKCRHESRNSNSFRELQLSFPQGKITRRTKFTVQALLDLYCASEPLDGDNQYACICCAKLCNGERSMKITGAPRNIILTIKQFNYDRQTHERTKVLYKVIHDDMITLNLCDGASLQQTYTVHYSLYAAIVHNGYTLDSGHYFDLAKDEMNNWFKFNDSKVVRSKPEDIKKLRSPNTAHFLLYQLSGRVCMAPQEGVPIIMPVSAVAPLELEELPPELRDFVKRNIEKLDRTRDNRTTTEGLYMQFLRSIIYLLSADGLYIYIVYTRCLDVHRIN